MTVNIRQDYSFLDDDQRRIMETSDELQGIVLELRALIEELYGTDEAERTMGASAFARPREADPAPVTLSSRRGRSAPEPEPVPEPVVESVVTYGTPLHVLETVDFNDVVTAAMDQLTREEQDNAYVELFPYALPIMLDPPTMVMVLAGVFQRFMETSRRADLEVSLTACGSRGGQPGEMDAYLMVHANIPPLSEEDVTSLCDALAEGLGIHEEMDVFNPGDGVEARTPSLRISSTRHGTSIDIRRPLQDFNA